MFPIFKIFVAYLIIPSPTNVDGIGNTKTFNSEELVEKEWAPIRDTLKKIANSLTNNELKFELGEVQGSMKKVIERAIKAEYDVKQLQIKCKMNRLHEEKYALMAEKSKTRLLEQKIEGLTRPLSIRNKATRIENRHPEIQGTIPHEILKKLKPFEKPLIQRQYKWMELLNCKDDLYIQKLGADLKTAFSKIKSKAENSYEQFKLDFCYALATAIEGINENIANYKYEGMQENLDVGVNDAVIGPYIDIFFNSVVCSTREKKNSLK